VETKIGRTRQVIGVAYARTGLSRDRRSAYSCLAVIGGQGAGLCSGSVTNTLKPCTRAPGAIFRRSTYTSFCLKTITLSSFTYPSGIAQSSALTITNSRTLSPSSYIPLTYICKTKGRKSEKKSTYPYPYPLAHFSS